MSNRACIGHVALGAVAQPGDHGEPLLLSRLHQPALGINFEADDPRIVLARARRTLLEPEREQPVRRRVRLQPLAAAVGDGQRGLEQDQALLGGKRRDRRCSALLTIEV